ncbi:MAG TPA: hypothetical protein VIM42_08425 [Clostridium sp.]
MCIEDKDIILKLQRQLNKTIEILGSSSVSICPNEFGLCDESVLCPEHVDCQKCWRKGLKTIK